MAGEYIVTRGKYEHVSVAGMVEEHVITAHSECCEQAKVTGTVKNVLSDTVRNYFNCKVLDRYM